MPMGRSLAILRPGRDKARSRRDGKAVSVRLPFGALGVTSNGVARLTGIGRAFRQRICPADVVATRQVEQAEYADPSQANAASALFPHLHQSRMAFSWRGVSGWQSGRKNGNAVIYGLLGGN